MSESEYDIEVAYANDPVGTTNAVIANAAAIAASELAAIQSHQDSAEYQRLRVAQSESAALTAIGEIENKYGADEWKRLQPRVEERLAQSPHLIPEEARTSPVALARSLEDVVKLVRGEADEADKQETWSRIKDNNATIPRYYR